MRAGLKDSEMYREKYRETSKSGGFPHRGKHKHTKERLLPPVEATMAAV
jgi:hypothetical protein